MESQSDDLGHGFVCGRCSSELIQPLEWMPVGPDRWCVFVRCPECFHFGDLFLDDDRADEFSCTLDEAVKSLGETADALSREVFRQECETFVQALRADLVEPLDF